MIGTTNIWERIKSDKIILFYTLLLVAISFFVVFSASSNLVNLYNLHSPWFYFIKHIILLFIAGVFLVTGLIIKPDVYKRYAFWMVMAVIVLLVYTFFFGVGASGTEAKRWIRLGPVSIQPSLIAIPVLMIFTVVYLNKIKNIQTSFSGDFKHFWLWVFIIIGLIVPHNNSTGLLLFVLVLSILWIGLYPFKKILMAIGVLFLLLSMYYLAAKAFPGVVPNRFHTVEKRIERFFHPVKDKSSIQNNENLQTQRSKIAIATGGLFNFQPGKSVQKNLLPQASSDFVFSIIIEEYGLIGGLIILFIYVLFIIRIQVISNKIDDYYNKLLIWAMALPIIAQAMINMFVSTGILPVTGQPLPLISTGGTTIMMTGFSIGVILHIAGMRKNKK